VKPSTTGNSFFKLDQWRRNSWMKESEYFLIKKTRLEMVSRLQEEKI
jgi:hypothetical protein